MRNVAIIGIGQTKFGEHWNKSLREMIYEAGNAAINDSGLEKSEIQSIFVGNMSGGRFVGQEHIGAAAAETLGLNIPAVRCEAACASGSAALISAIYAVKSGKINTALVLGVEKMTDVSTSSAILSLAAAGDQEWEASFGLTFAGTYALMAKKHMNDFGTTKEQLALVAVNNHKNAVNNPFAQFPYPIKLEDVLEAPPIAEPLGLYDCSPLTDGAAAVIITNEDIANNHDPVWIIGSGQGSDSLALHKRPSITEMRATKEAAKTAFSEAGINRNDIDVVEVHDCFTINEIIGLEDLGFCEKGKGGVFVERGEIQKDGSLPTNTTGGLKACGHPVGATGIRQAIDIVRQLKGKSFNQINGVKYGLTLNVGGSGATAIVNIFAKEIK